MKYHPFFQGVFPINKIPKLRTIPTAFVVNNQTANLPGQHWIAVWVSEKMKGEVFDPMGMIPPPRLQLWMNKNTWRWIYNAAQIQRPLSEDCGWLCVNYLKIRPKTRSMEDTIFKILSMY